VETKFVIEPGMQVPVLLEHYPQTRKVLDRYGLHGCGGAHGPAESLQFFARAHEVHESTLMAELKLAAAQPDDLASMSLDIVSNVDDTIYRRFFPGGNRGRSDRRCLLGDLDAVEDRHRSQLCWHLCF
jgi:hypothetical protein